MIKRQYFIILGFLLFSCSSKAPRIKSLEETFEIVLPKCYTKVTDSSTSDWQDFTIELTFDFNEGCFQDVKSELNKADKFLYSDDHNFTIYFHQVTASESATLTIDKKNKTLEYFFVHI